MPTKIYSAITEPTQSHPERALYKQTYVNTMMALLPALMKAAPQISATVAHETLVLGPGFTFAIDIDGFGRAITFEPVSYTHLRAHETRGNHVWRLRRV